MMCCVDPIELRYLHITTRPTSRERKRVTMTCDCGRVLDITLEAAKFETRHKACDCGEVWRISEIGKTITSLRGWIKLMRETGWEIGG